MPLTLTEGVNIKKTRMRLLNKGRKAKNTRLRSGLELGQMFERCYRQAPEVLLSDTHSSVKISILIHYLTVSLTYAVKNFKMPGKDS